MEHTSDEGMVGTDVSCDAGVESRGIETGVGVGGGVSYQPPPGYVLVELGQYNLMLSALQQMLRTGPVTPEHKELEKKKKFFHLRMKRQYLIGDIGHNLVPGEEVDFCPREYVKIGGLLQTKLRSFQAIWNMQYGPNPDPAVLSNPIFEILNPDECPWEEIEQAAAAGARGRQARSEWERIQQEERRGDAAYHRGPRELQAAGVKQTVQPGGLPPRGGVRGPDGLTERARQIKAMQGDAIERPARRVTTGESAEGTDVSDIPVNAGIMAGGRAVARIGGPAADEARDLNYPPPPRS